MGTIYHFPDISPDEALHILKNGVVEDIHATIPWGSNHTFLVNVQHQGKIIQAVYKPEAGTRPLWDFPAHTLCLREQAAFEISESVNWHIIPPTALRHGPHGRGSLQMFISHDPEDNYFTFDEKLFPQLKHITLFDHVTNNADRKGGHCLLDNAGKIWAIDHGLCFHEHPKLRTVIWDFAGQPIPPPLLEDVDCLLTLLDSDPFASRMRELLSPAEIDALRSRCLALVASGTFPSPGSRRHYPWPPV